MATGGRPLSDGVSMHTGARFGFLVVRRKVHTKAGLRYQVECLAPSKKNPLVACGKKFNTRTQYLTRKPNPQVHCGCQLYLDANPYPREKGIWQMMHQRTENPGHVSYKDYGGRGIKVCEFWNKANPNGWLNFINYMGGAPTKNHSIDRVNPNLGYQPYQEDGKTPQCRWATATEQANNQRRHWAKK